MIEITHKNNEAKSIIILVHGFKGGKSTWIKENGEKLFIDGLLCDKNIIENFDVGIFSYYSKLLEFFPKSSRFFVRLILKKRRRINSSIDDLGNFLGTSIKEGCKQYENIILIGHSMGGLVAKRYLLNDCEKNETSKVKLYVSLATPHNGSHWAKYGKLIIDNCQMMDLSPLSATSARMNLEWAQCKNLPARLFGYGLSDEIVPKESAISIDRDPQEPITSDHDHFSIIQPKDNSDNIVLSLRNYLLLFLQDQGIINNEKHLKQKQKISEFRTKLLASPNKEGLENLLIEVKIFAKVNPYNIEINKLEGLINSAIRYEKYEKDNESNNYKRCQANWDMEYEIDNKRFNSRRRYNSYKKKNTLRFLNWIIIILIISYIIWVLI